MVKKQKYILSQKINFRKKHIHLKLFLALRTLSGIFYFFKFHSIPIGNGSLELSFLDKILNFLNTLTSFL